MAEIRGFQAELARKMDISPAQVHIYLSGLRKPGLEQLDKFAQAMGLNPWELIKPDGVHEKPMSAIEHLETALSMLKKASTINVDNKTVD